MIVKKEGFLKKENKTVANKLPLNVQSVALVGLLTAMLTGAKMALAAVPNVEVVTLLCALFGFVFFKEGFSGFYIFLSGFVGGGTGGLLNFLLESLHVFVVLFKFKSGLFAGTYIADGGDDLSEIKFNRQFGDVSGNVHAESVAHFFNIVHFCTSLN